MSDLHVRRTADDYAEVFAGSLPIGAAWPRDPDTVLMRIVSGLMGNWGDADGRIDDLLVRESDPRFTYEMLPDWESALALPDPCVPVVQTLSERRVAVVNKLTTEGGQSRAFFIALAATLGYTITITEYRPFQFGLSAFGGPRGQFQGPRVRFFWKIRVSGGRSTRFQFGLSSFGRDSFLEIRKAEDLECMIGRWKPAHTVVIFDYHDADITLQIERFEFGKSSFGADPFAQVVAS